jgi:pilus assembly protein CpaE
MLKVVSQRTMNTNQQLLADEPGTSVSAGAGRVYAVYSPRGGAGKTMLAVNLAALQAQDHPERTLLLDLSLTFGHTAALLGLEPCTSLAEVPAESIQDIDRRTLGDYLVGHRTGLQVLVACTRPEQGEVVTAAHVRATLASMKRQFSAIFVDCGSGLDDPTIAALEMADTVFVVSTPELTTLRDIRECLRIFSEIVHVDPNKVCLVLNQHQPFAALSRARFEAALEQPMAFELPHAGEAAYKAAARGEPLALGSSGAAYVKAVDRIRRAKVPIETKPTRSSGGLLGMLRRKRAS